MTLYLTIYQTNQMMTKVILKNIKTVKYLVENQNINVRNAGKFLRIAAPSSCTNEAIMNLNHLNVINAAKSLAVKLFWRGIFYGMIKLNQILVTFAIRVFINVSILYFLYLVLYSLCELDRYLITVFTDAL